jgi:hypothetical protein
MIMTKITKVSVKNGIMQMPVTVDLERVVERMRDGKGFACREQPRLVFSATFGRGGFDDVRQMTGLLLLTASADSERQVREWQQQVMAVPYTVLAFRGFYSKDLQVVVRMAFADGHEPSDTDEYLRMLEQGRRQIVTLYQSLTECRFMSEDVTLQSGCHVSNDPQACYHAGAQAFPVIMKDVCLIEKYRCVKVNEDGSILSSPTDNDIDRWMQEYYACLQQSIENSTADAADEQVVADLASRCQRARLEEEQCVQRTLWQPRVKLSEDAVRKIFRTAYTRRLQGRAVSQMNQKERIARSIRDFFQRRYQLRYNVVKQLTEFRPNDLGVSLWRPLTDRDLKRIAFEEMLEGGQGWMIDIELYVNSSLVERYHPILEFLGGTGTWDRRRNYIEEFARRLQTDYDRWPHFFHRWLLAMVAQAMNKSRDYGNSMVPLLIGPQAMKKSSFCKSILPYSMREYYMDDIKMDSPEQVERVLGRMWLVNIDEYDGKTEREQAKIKRLLTEKDVQIRKMRSDQYTMTPRLCSFIATTNAMQPLCDTTGTRRYLCVEVTGQTDMTGSVNYQQMYAQAVWEIEHGEQYWFDNDDEREITAHNEQYLQRNTMEDVVGNIIMPAEQKKENFMTSTQIQKLLREELMAADVPTLGKLGRCLRRLHIPTGSLNGKRGYYLHLRS